MKTGRRGILLSFVALLALGSAGCSASSKYMKPVRGGSIDRAADAATIVFIRPSGYAAAMKTTILDGNGRFLGDSLASSHFAVKVPPGEHVFIAWAENTAAMRATVEAGKVYFVEVASKIGAFTARMHLLAITPRSKSWKQLDEWLKDSAAYAVDETAGQAYLQSRKDDTEERIRRANEALKEYSAEELAERTLTPGDAR